MDTQAPGFQWSAESMQAGLCGGAYFRTEAVLDSWIISKAGNVFSGCVSACFLWESN